MVSSSGAGGCMPTSSTETTVEAAKKAMLRQAAVPRLPTIPSMAAASAAAATTAVFGSTPPQPLQLPQHLGSQRGAYRLVAPLHSGQSFPAGNLGPMPDPMLLAPSRQYLPPPLIGFPGKTPPPPPPLPPPPPPLTTQPPGLAFQPAAPPLRRPLVPTGATAYFPPGPAAIFNGFVNNGSQQPPPFPAFQPLQPTQQYPQSQHQQQQQQQQQHQHQHQQHQQHQQHPGPSRTPESDVSDPELALRLLSRGLDHPLPISIDLIREAVDRSNSMSALAECLTELEKVSLMCLFRWNKERMCESACLGPSFTNWKHIMHLSLTRHFLVTSQTLQAGMTSMSHFTYELGRRLRQFAQARRIDCTDNDGRLNNLLAESGEFCSVILDVILSSRKDVISDFLFLLGNHTEDQIITKLENQPRLLPALRSFRTTAGALEKARPEHQVLLLASLLGLHQVSEKPRAAAHMGEASPSIG